MSWKNEIVEVYREKLGCKNEGVCWCDVCIAIEKIIETTIDYIKANIDK